MDQNDMLSSLFSDPDKLQQAISMASSLLGGQQGGAGAAPPPPPMPDAMPDEMPEPPLSAQAQAPVPDMPPPPAFPSFPPGGFSPPSGASGRNEYDPSAEILAKAMPIIQTITRSSQTALKRERVNLLNSVKPFVQSGTGSQIDRAMRLVSMARVARNTMGMLGKRDGPAEGEE